MPNGSDTLVVTRLGFQFESKRRSVHVLEEVNFRVETGDCVAILGRSGVGKSTLINLIAGFFAPTAGKIYAFGHTVKGPDKSRLTVFQESGLWPWLSVRENLVLGLDKSAPDFRSRFQEAEELLVRIGLGDAVGAYAGQLSGGMQKRAELARAIVARPRILMLDEALRSVDWATKKICVDLIDEFRDTHKAAVLMVSHDLDEVTRLASHAIILEGAPATVGNMIELAKFGGRSSQRAKLSRLLGYAT